MNNNTLKKKEATKLDKFIISLFKLIKVYLIGLLIFFAFRLALILSFGDLEELNTFRGYLLDAFWVGFRFDTMVLVYFMLPVLPVIFAGLFIPANNYRRFLKLQNKVLFWYYFVLYILLFIVLTVDFYYFKFFQSHFNLLVFGIVEDDTTAVLKSVWTDYPVIGVLILFAVVGFLLYWMLKRFAIRCYNPFGRSVLVKTVFVVLFFLLFAIGMRGSLGMRPIRKEHTTVSPNRFINSIVPNGIYALKDAWRDRNKYSIDRDINKTLELYDFNNSRQAIESFLGYSIKEGDDPIEHLYDETPPNPFLEENPPNVVFLLMESMSNHYFDLHSESLNLLGSLEYILDDLFLYRNFLPIHNGTIYTLEGLLINSPLGPMVQSSYFQSTFLTSSALPFYKNNYNTAFVTGSQLGWRNLGIFIENQYFEQIEGRSHILENVSGAEEGSWGVYDEFMFTRIYDILTESASKDEPAFVFGFTTTNHTPYDLPAAFEPQNVNLCDSIRGALRTNEDLAVKNFISHQYAKDCMGKFMKKIIDSPLGENTIIVATGDHNVMQLFNYRDADLLYKFSVPLIMYVPEKYKINKTFDTNIFASHKDIFPTLFNLSLSNTKYVNSGFDILDGSINRNEFYAVNSYNTVLNNTGAVVFENSPLFYKWSPEVGNELIPADDESPELKRLLLKGRAYSAAMTLLIQNELIRINN